MSSGIAIFNVPPRGILMEKDWTLPAEGTSDPNTATTVLCGRNFMWFSFYLTYPSHLTFIFLVTFIHFDKKKFFLGGGGLYHRSGHKRFLHPRCTLTSQLLSVSSCSKYLSCVGFPACKTAVWFPDVVLEVSRDESTCPTCQPHPIHMWVLICINLDSIKAIPHRSAW